MEHKKQLDCKAKPENITNLIMAKATHKPLTVSLQDYNRE